MLASRREVNFRMDIVALFTEPSCRVITLYASYSYDKLFDTIEDKENGCSLRATVRLHNAVYSARILERPALY